MPSNEGNDHHADDCEQRAGAETPTHRVGLARSLRRCRGRPCGRRRRCVVERRRWQRRRPPVDRGRLWIHPAFDATPTSAEPRLRCRIVAVQGPPVPVSSFLRHPVGQELVPGPGAVGVPRGRQQRAVADRPAAGYANRHHPSAAVALPSGNRETGRPNCSLAVQPCPARGRPVRPAPMLDETGRHVAGIDWLDSENRRGPGATTGLRQLARIVQAVVIELARPAGSSRAGHCFPRSARPGAWSSGTPRRRQIDAHDGRLHQMRRRRPGRGPHEVPVASACRSVLVAQ